MNAGMNVTIEFARLGRLLSEYVQIGYMGAVKAYEPAQDLIRQTEVGKWLKMTYADKDLFKKLVKKGLIRPRRIGGAANSPLYYSKEEIKRAIAAVGVLRIVEGRPEGG